MGSKASCVLWLTGGGVALASHEQEAGSSAQLGSHPLLGGGVSRDDDKYRLLVREV